MIIQPRFFLQTCFLKVSLFYLTFYARKIFFFFQKKALLICKTRTELAYKTSCSTLRAKWEFFFSSVPKAKKSFVFYVDKIIYKVIEKYITFPNGPFPRLLQTSQFQHQALSVFTFAIFVHGYYIFFVNCTFVRYILFCFCFLFSDICHNRKFSLQTCKWSGIPDSYQGNRKTNKMYIFLTMRKGRTGCDKDMCRSDDPRRRK